MKKRNVIILLGGPGAGKGTQAETLSHWLKIPHISSGQLLRSEVAACSPLGLRAKAIIDAGALVGDELVDELILHRIGAQDCNRGFILDGYPRNAGQAVTLECNLPISDRQIVIDIVTEPETIISRLTNRRTCRSCGAIYHLIAAPPKREGACDECGDALIQRSDDHEEVIRQRLKAYHEMTEGLKNLYQQKRIYYPVDGMRPARDVGDSIRELIESEVFELLPPLLVAG